MPRRTWLEKPSPNSPTHLYIDMSGGIEPARWISAVADVVARLKHMSKLLDQPLMLHMTGFSHDVADDAVPIAVTAEYPSDEELAELIHQMPKVSGGTYFNLVFDRINSNQERSERYNVIVSDLLWATTPEMLARDHPEHLDYIAVEGTLPSAKQYFIKMLHDANLPEEHDVS